MKSRIRFVVMLGMLLVFFSAIGVAQDCIFATTCPINTIPIFSASGITNAHLAYPNYDAFLYKVCCNRLQFAFSNNNIQLISSASASLPSTPSQEHYLLSLSSDTGGHAQFKKTLPSTIGIGFGFNVYTNAKHCQIYNNQCPNDKTCVLSLSNTINSHAGSCTDNNFESKLCCQTCKRKEDPCNTNADCCPVDEDGNVMYCSAGKFLENGTWSAQNNKHCCKVGDYWNPELNTCSTALTTCPIACTTNPVNLNVCTNFASQAGIWQACCNVSYGGVNHKHWLNILTY